MDQKTFDELYKEGELGLILMDGGKNLTKEQMQKVKAKAKRQSEERLMEMAAELAGKPSVWLRFFGCNLECNGFGQREPTKPDTWELLDEENETYNAKVPDEISLEDLLEEELELDESEFDLDN